MTTGEQTPMSTTPLVMSAPALVPHRSPLSAAEVRAVIDATADAGFAGLSIWTEHHDWAVADGMSSDDYVAYHRDRGLTIPAAEVLLDWADAADAGISDATVHALDVAALAGARYVIATLIEPSMAPLSAAAASLALLCDRAAERGLAVSVEFLPFARLATIADVARLIEHADRDNLGLVLDAWHWFRQPGGPDLATLCDFPADRIHVLQLNDALAERPDDLMAETMTGRLLPGAADVDLPELLSALDELGAAPVVACEVFSSALGALGPAENARRQFAAAERVLEHHHEGRRDA